MEIFLLYAFTRLDAIGTFAGVVSVVGLMSGFVAMFIHMGCESELRENSSEGDKKITKRIGSLSRCLLVAGFVSAIICVLTPTQKDAAIILAGAGILEVAKTDAAQRLASKSVQLIEQTLDGYLKADEAKK